MRPAGTRLAGFTLLELLVALALVGLVLGIAIPMVGDIMDLRIKGTARQLAGTIQYLYGQAATQRLYVRLVYDLDKQSYWAESSRDRFLLVKEEDGEDKKLKEEKAKKEKQATEGAASTGFSEEGDSKKKQASFGAEEGFLVKPKELPADVLFKDVYALHQKEPATQGQAYTYFFPSGLVEWSIINLKDDGDHVNYSLEIQPITGRVKIRKSYLDYREALKGDDAPKKE